MTTVREGPARVSFTGVLLSEQIKARGLRSTWWLLGLALVVPITVAVATAATATVDPANHDALVAAAIGAVVDTNFLPLLFFLLVGTFVGTTEFERAAVMTTFAVVPRRIPVVLAKATLVSVVVLVVGFVSALVSYLVAALILGGDAPATLGDDSVLRVLVGTALYECAAATIALCIGLLLRSSIGAFAATVGFLYVIPGLLQAIPVEAVIDFARTIPGPASSALETPAANPDGLGFPAALAAIVAWTAAWLVITCTTVRRRDI